MISTRTRWQHPTQGWSFGLATHRCCGLQWEILLSRRYPDRERTPVCPQCGAGDMSPPYDAAADLASRPAAVRSIMPGVIMVPLSDPRLLHSTLKRIFGE